MTSAERVALITGVAGQDGALLAALLVREGYRVVGMLQPGSEPSIDAAQLLHSVDLPRVDLRDQQGLSRLLQESRPDEVYNLGGISSVAASWQDPVNVTEVNGVAVLRLLELLRQQDRPVRFLQASSAEMFGNPEVVPQDESTPLEPRNPYATAKTFAHHVTATYRQAYGLHASTVILYNHESALRDPSFVTRKITSTVAAIDAGQASELVLGDIDLRRDWGHARDYVQAMYLAVQHETPDDYVVATGASHSIREFLDVAFAQIGIDDWSGYVRTDPRFIRPTDAPQLSGDARKARRVLGWATGTDFEGLVAEMVEHDRRLLRSAGR